MKIGSSDISAAYIGSTAINKVYIGSTEVWSSMDADYAAILNYATTQGYTLPSASQRLLQEQLIVDLKNAGIWTKLDILYVFATDGDSDFASVNWKDPNNYKITQVNSPSFTSNLGFTGDATSAYLDTNYIPSTNGVNFTLNDASAMYYRENNANATTFTMGNKNNDLCNNFREDNNNRIWLNSGRSLTSADGTGGGFFMITRNNSSTSTHYKGTSATTLSNPSTNVGASEVVALAGASTVGFSASTLQILSLGADLSSEVSDYKNSCDSYITSL